jgi:hypothetical protein
LTPPSQRGGSGSDVEPYNSAFGQGVRVKDEIFVLLKQRRAAAACNATLGLSLGTGPEVAQATEIALGARLNKEDVHLMMGNTDRMIDKELGKSPASRTLEAGEIVRVVHPYRQIYVLAVVEHLPTPSRDPGF